MPKLKPTEKRYFDRAVEITKKLREEGETQGSIAKIMNRSRVWVNKYLSTTKVDKKSIK